MPAGPPTNVCVPALLSRLLQDVFCASADPPVLELANRIFPPALKKNLASSAVENVTVTVAVKEFTQEDVNVLLSMASVTNCPVPRSNLFVVA